MPIPEPSTGSDVSLEENAFLALEALCELLLDLIAESRLMAETIHGVNLATDEQHRRFGGHLVASGLVTRDFVEQKLFQAGRRLTPTELMVCIVDVLPQLTAMALDAQNTKRAVHAAALDAAIVEFLKEINFPFGQPRRE